MSTAATGPGSGGYRWSTRAPIALPARSYDADSGPPGPCCWSGRGADRLQGTSTSGGPDVLEHRGRRRAVVRSCGKIPWSRFADRRQFLRARSTPTKFLPCAVCRHSPRPRRSARREGGCPWSVPHFCAPPLRAGALFCNTPLSGVHYPPLGGVVPPLGGVSAPFGGI